MPKFLSRRMIFSQIATLYDPLALISHFTVKAELHLRGVIVNNLGNGWGEPVNQFLHVKANLFTRELFDLEECMEPTKVVGDPVLLVFSDVSPKAYGACAYL